MMEDVIGRLHGPMNFRLFLQPLMAISFGFRDARRDARDRSFTLASSPFIR